MPNYRRSLVPGGTFFFTVVTENRQPILLEPGRTLLRHCVRQCMNKYPFTIEATALLPDHLHAIWTLPEGDAEYSKRWGFIKKEFTKAWLKQGHAEQSVSWARRRERRCGVWVPRFWEHTIRDENDFRRHMDYIHFNPVKHAHASCPHAWPSSSFHRAVRRGLYESDWGCSCHARRSSLVESEDSEDMERTVGEDPFKWTRDGAGL